MRSALVSVKGVKQATVVFERAEAHVEYDPKQCSPDDLILAVTKAKGPMRFGAIVKK